MLLVRRANALTWDFPTSNLQTSVIFACFLITGSHYFLSLPCLVPISLITLSCNYSVLSLLRDGSPGFSWLCCNLIVIFKKHLFRNKTGSAFPYGLRESGCLHTFLPEAHRLNEMALKRDVFAMETILWQRSNIKSLKSWAFSSV